MKYVFFRPLPDELKMYAREDTHYLIYIYHLLKNKLLQKGNGNDNFLRAVYQRSTEVCKKVEPVLCVCCLFEINFCL